MTTKSDPRNGQAFRKNQLIVVVGIHKDGGVKVHNQGDTKDQWVIPADVFASTYEAAFPEPGEVFDFGDAVKYAKKGKKVARSGWNGKGMWIVYMPGLQLPSFNTQEPGPRVNDRTAKHIGEDTALDSQPYFAMWTAAQQWQPGWLASQADVLAEDWVIVE